MQEDSLAELETAPSNHVSALDEETLSRVDRIRADLEWLADFPSYNWVEVEPRKRIHLATVLARAMHSVPMAIPFELKNEDRAECDVGPETKTVDIELRTAWARRVISRDFYFIQFKLFRWGEAFKVSDYLAEFHLRAADVMDVYPIEAGLVSLLPRHTATVLVTCPVAGAFLERLCELDRHFAATISRGLEKDKELLEEYFELLNEPLTWIKNRPSDTRTSRFRLRAAGAHVEARKKSKRKQKLQVD